MTVTERQRRFNNARGGGLTVAESDDERMQREAKHGQRVQESLERDAQRAPVTQVRSLKVVNESGDFLPVLPAEFVAETIAKLQVHIGRGHWEQAKAVVDAAEREWGVMQIEREPENVARAEKLHWHVSSLFEPRTANLIESVCNGTIGALLECFPQKFKCLPNCGPLTIEKIAARLLRIGAINEARYAECVGDDIAANRAITPGENPTNTP